MKNMEREKFEESLRSAFEKAEIAPSDKVWTNIELDLEKEKGGDLKKRLLFYQMLAAASVVFAMAIGGAGLYYNWNQAQPAANNLAGQTQHLPETENSGRESQTPGIVSTPGETTPSAYQEKSAVSPNLTDREDNAITTTDNVGVAGRTTHAETPEQSAEEIGAVALETPGDKYPELPDALEERSLPPLYAPKRIALHHPMREETVDPVVAMMADLERREREVRGEENTRKGDVDENLWTSIGFAAGSFNAMQTPASNPGPATMMMSAAAAPIVDQETKGSGYSYSMGVNVGTKISARWVLQGGVNYLTHASEYTANNVVVSSTQYQQLRFRPATSNEVINATDNDLSNKIVYSAPYNVNNSMRYLSVPLQAGYLLVNKTFGLQLNAGVATDLFLQNTVTADSDQLDKTSQGGGADSPYRTLNFSGLLGTEVSYRFGDHYRIALNPGIRYPFSPIYKTELGVQSTPLTFDVGVRFRYIFR